MVLGYLYGIVRDRTEQRPWKSRLGLTQQFGQRDHLSRLQELAISAHRVVARY
jgi:hypothetical protein